MYVRDDISKKRISPICSGVSTYPINDKGDRGSKLSGENSIKPIHKWTIAPGTLATWTVNQRNQWALAMRRAVTQADQQCRAGLNAWGRVQVYCVGWSHIDSHFHLEVNEPLETMLKYA